MIFKRAFICASLIAPLQVSIAQTPAGFVTAGISGTQFWDGADLYSVSADSRRVEVQSPHKKSRSFNLPDKALLTNVESGVAYAVHREKAKGTELLRSSDFQHWDPEVYFEDKNARILDIQPLNHRRYLLIRALSPFVKDDKASFLAIARSNDQGKLEIESLVDLGVDLFNRLPPLEGFKGPRMVPKAGLEALAFEISLSQLTRFPGGFALVLRSSGRIYVFNPESGAFRWEALLYPSIEAPEHRAKPKEFALLGCRPTRDGHLLVCSRTEDAVLNSRSIFEGVKLPDATGISDEKVEAYQQAVEAANDKALEAFPDIIWWDFDPVTAHFVKLDPPHQMPTKIFKTSTFQAFNFVMDVNNKPVLSK